MCQDHTRHADRKPSFLTIYNSILYYYFVAHILPIISFMNFSLLYFLFLYTFATSNDCLCYFICHYYILLFHYLCRYLFYPSCDHYRLRRPRDCYRDRHHFAHYSSFLIVTFSAIHFTLFFLNIPVPHSLSLARSTCYTLSSCVYDSMRD